MNVLQQDIQKREKKHKLKKNTLILIFEYESLTTVVEGDEYQFIVIPKSLDATLRIWKYNEEKKCQNFI